MTKRKKPTGDGEGSKLHDAVLETKMLRAAQEETVALEDDYWSESDAPAGHKPRSWSKIAHAKSKPSPIPTPTVLDLSSDSDVVVLPQTPPKNNASHSSTTYHAKKVPEVTVVKGPPSKHRKTDQKAAEAKPLGLLRWKSLAVIAPSSGSQRIYPLLQSDAINWSVRSTAWLWSELSNPGPGPTREAFDTAETTAKIKTMVMTMYGIPLPPSTSGEGSGPSLALALAGFLQARVPPLLPASSVLTRSTNAPTTKVASAAPLPADLMTAPTTLDGRENSLDQSAELAPYEPTEEALDASCEASGSNLSAAEKGKLPVYLRN
ncbi:hypothetical protein RSOLAG22IIIB_13505 [Rhizoctonia solani]|uniref:Uncharacterized protein n=1 Tax=Rhizoctonia solani TaxID=456999 RepID=A0A0K6FN11_9AGAM|nr:hypothetical protein RSOLAG22IIIB_13505 [Rhizoctonia solani]